MKNLFAMAVPILPGKTPQWKKFISELNNNQSFEYTESRKNLGVRERTFFQTTPHGDFVVVTLEGENPQEAFKNFGKGTDAFTKWFLKEVKEIHGIDFSNPPAGPLPELVIDSEAKVLQN